MTIVRLENGMKHGTKEPSQARSGFTLIEILVVVAIIAIIVAILLPVFLHAREKARQATCASNLRQIGLAASLYEQDYDEAMFPPFDMGLQFGGPIETVTTWSFNEVETSSEDTVDSNRGLLGPYIRNSGVWYCPSATRNEMTIPGSAEFPPYGLNHSFMRWWIKHRKVVSLGDIEASSETILTADSGAYRQDFGRVIWSKWLLTGSNDVQGRHDGMANVLWCDGHVKAVKPTTIPLPNVPGLPTLSVLKDWNLGMILKGPYAGNPQIDDYYYELKKP